MRRGIHYAHFSEPRKGSSQGQLHSLGHQDGTGCRDGPDPGGWPKLDVHLLRASARLSLEEFAALCGTEPTLVERWEQEYRAPPLVARVLRALAGELGAVDPAWDAWRIAGGQLWHRDEACGYAPAHVLGMHWLQEINAALRGRLRVLGQEIPPALVGPWAAGLPDYVRESRREASAQSESHQNQEQRQAAKVRVRASLEPEPVSKRAAVNHRGGLALSKPVITAGVRRAIGASLLPGGRPSLAGQEASSGVAESSNVSASSKAFGDVAVSAGVKRKRTGKVSVAGQESVRQRQASGIHARGPAATEVSSPSALPINFSSGITIPSSNGETFEFLRPDGPAGVPRPLACGAKRLLPPPSVSTRKAPDVQVPAALAQPVYSPITAGPRPNRAQATVAGIASNTTPVSNSNRTRDNFAPGPEGDSARDPPREHILVQAQRATVAPRLEHQRRTDNRDIHYAHFMDLRSASKAEDRLALSQPISFATG